MSRIMLIAAAAVLINSTASAQTKDQCAVVSNSLLPLITSMAPAEKAVSSINWNIVIPTSTGQFRNAAETARRAQENFLEAVQRYRIALEDLAHEAQLCAR